MLQVAERAIADAAMDDVERLRTGVFVGVELDLNTTNYHLRWAVRSRAADWARRLERPTAGAEFQNWVDELCDALTPALNANRTIGGLGSIVASRVAREFGLGGPSYVLASEETSGMSALQAAIRALQTRRLDCAVVGAVDLSGDVRALLSLARMDEAVPRLIGGSKKRAEQRFRLVLEQDPHFTRAMLDYAEFLDHRGREEEGLKLVNRALSEEQPKYPGAYRKFDRPRAEALREKLSR